jgi:hypothetical protein
MVHRDTLATALGWTLERTEHALISLGDRLVGTGQRLHRLNGGVYCLRAAHEPLSDDERHELERQRTAGRGLERWTAIELSRIVRQPHGRSAVTKLPEARGQAVQRLVSLGLVTVGDDQVGLHEDVAYSLRLGRPSGRRRVAS